MRVSTDASWSARIWYWCTHCSYCRTVLASPLRSDVVVCAHEGHACTILHLAGKVLGRGVVNDVQVFQPLPPLRAVPASCAEQYDFQWTGSPEWQYSSFGDRQLAPQSQYLDWVLFKALLQGIMPWTLFPNWVEMSHASCFGEDEVSRVGDFTAFALAFPAVLSLLLVAVLRAIEPAIPKVTKGRYYPDLSNQGRTASVSVMAHILRVAFLVNMVQVPLSLHIAMRSSRRSRDAYIAGFVAVSALLSISPLSLSAIKWSKGNFIVRSAGKLLSPLARLLHPPLSLYRVAFAQQARFFVWLVVPILVHCFVVVTTHYGEYPKLASLFQMINYGIEPGARGILAVKMLEWAANTQVRNVKL
jgi:hypothetical protein